MMVTCSANWLGTLLATSVTTHVCKGMPDSEVTGKILLEGMDPIFSVACLAHFQIDSDLHHPPKTTTKNTKKKPQNN